MGHELFDAAGAIMHSGGNPNRNLLCGMQIGVTREIVEVLGEEGKEKGNASIDVMVVDRCSGCDATDLDLAPGVFAMLAPESRAELLGGGSGWLSFWSESAVRLVLLCDGFRHGNYVSPPGHGLPAPPCFMVSTCLRSGSVVRVIDQVH